MDVDMRSPSFTIMRPTPTASSSKRPRSPPSPTSAYDRPNKRITLDPMTTRFPSGLPSPVPTPPPLAIRQVSEDWVSRTRGLRIDRDYAGPVAVIEEELRRQEGHSDDMTMDDESMSEPWPSSGFAHPPNTIATIPALSHPSPLRPLPGFDLHSIQRQRQPSVTIPDMSTLPDEPYASDPTPLTPTTPTRSSRMELQPENVALPLSPPRRPRFTMGPRLDCEKCRLRVPGHYSHFN